MGTCSLLLGAARPGMGSAGRRPPAPTKNPKPVAQWGRAGANQAPNGFQAPMLKAGMGSRLSSCAPSQQSGLALPGGWGRRKDSRGDRGALNGPPAFPPAGPGSPEGCVCTCVGRSGGAGPKAGFLDKPIP